MSNESIPLRVWQPKYSVQKKHEKNCGLHCISMITHLPIPIIIEQIKSGPTNFKQLCNAMLMLGWDSSFDVIKTKNWKALPKLAILDLHKSGKRHGHWAVWYDGIIYDSCVGAWDKINDYCEATGLRLKGYIEVKLVQ